LGVRNLVGVRFSAKVDTGQEAHLASFYAYNGYGGSLPRLKQPELDVYLQPLSRGEVRKE
jgi:hypothetical protein